MQTLAEHLLRAAQLCDSDDPAAPARPELRRLVATLVDVAGRHAHVWMSPPSTAAPCIVLLRTLGKLAERTSGTTVILDECSARRLDDLEREMAREASSVRLGYDVAHAGVAGEHGIEGSMDSSGCRGDGGCRRGVPFGRRRLVGG